MQINWRVIKVKERGMMKWKPFVSMVEQQRAIDEVLNEFSKIEKPILDEWQYEENSRRLMESFLSQERMELIYYERGKLISITGWVEKMNEAYRYLLVSNEQINRKKITFDAIIEVKVLYK